MKRKETKENIVRTARSLFARHGYDGFTMRTLAHDCDISLSSIYHHFQDKDVMLKTIFDETSTELGVRRAALPAQDTASDALRQRIQFQFDNAESILFVLRYYLHFRDTFPKLKTGFLNDKAYLHIKEVLEQGRDSGEFHFARSIDEEAKVIAHSINGFVLEYFPETPSKREYDNVVDSIHSFLVRSLTNPAGTPA